MNAKCFVFTLSLMVVCGCLSAQEMVLASSVETASITSVAWESPSVDLGEIPQGVPVTHRFEFTNTGAQPLTIESVKASCGCTATEYASGEIAPGETGYVLATYNAASPGFFHKSVTVRLNTESGVSVLKIKGQVLKAEESEPVGED